VAATIGDVVDSRSHDDRQALQRALIEALTAANAHTDPIQPFQMTIGDEFQGVHRSAEAATHATFLVQLQLVGTARVRFGIGLGTITMVSDHTPFGQDGPAWWRARSAIAEVKDAERRYGEPPRWATAIEGGADRKDSLRAYLQLRDHLMGEIDRTDADILHGLLRGNSQNEIARKLEIDKGAVSRRVSGHGLSALLWALRAVRP
jgi:hypothetical protein